MVEGRKDMRQHLFYNGIHQLFALTLALLKVKLFVRMEGMGSQAGIVATLSLWGVIQLLCEDQRHLIRMMNRNTYSFSSNFYRAIQESFGHKLLILVVFWATISVTQNDKLQINALAFLIVVFFGYLLSTLSALTTGMLEGMDSYKKLSFSHILVSIINFCLFIPLIDHFGSIGYLTNILITNSMLTFVLTYFLVLNEIKGKQFMQDRLKPTFDLSRLYSRVLILESCVYAFDPLVVSAFRSNEAAVEYSLTRRIGILMTIIPIATHTFFALNGSESAPKKGFGSLRFLSVSSAITFLFVSSYLLQFALGYTSSHILLLQAGMVFLGITSIFCSPLIASKSSDIGIQNRYQILVRIVPITMIISSIGIYFIGAVTPFLVGSIYLMVYRHFLNNASK